MFDFIKAMFDVKKASLSYTPIFVSGIENNENITKFAQDKCNLNFKDAKMIISQKQSFSCIEMQDVKSINLWDENGFLNISVATKNNSVYNFKFQSDNNGIVATIVVKPLEKYFTAFGVPFALDQKPDMETKSDFNLFFLGADELRQKDGNVQRGDCVIDFSDSEFVIRQGSEEIKNEISSIYYFGIWEHEQYTYCKFRMRSGVEYKFGASSEQIENLKNTMQKYGISVEDDRI